MTAPLPPDDSPVYVLADAIEAAMETEPVSFGWTPSMVARRARVDLCDGRRPLTTDEAWQTLEWMTNRVFVNKDDRGAWSRYYRRP
jgi:hypothetical protein